MGGTAVSRSLAEGTTVPGLIVPDPADKLVRRADGARACRNARDERDDQKMPGDRKNRYKAWGAGMVNPLRTSSSPPPLLPPSRHPEGPAPVPWQLLGPIKRVGNPSGTPAVGCLRPRISNSTVWNCGSGLKGRATSASSLPLENRHLRVFKEFPF